jgi:hypothetical protein
MALLAGAYTDFLLKREDLGTSLLLCPGKMFRQEYKMLFRCIPYSAQFNNVFEALILLLIIFYAFLAEIKQPGNGIQLLSITQEFWLKFCHG